jgi:hypothetical protein
MHSILISVHSIRSKSLDFGWGFGSFRFPGYVRDLPGYFLPAPSYIQLSRTLLELQLRGQPFCLPFKKICMELPINVPY